VSGRLVLVPNLLGIVPPEHVLPTHTIETARALRHFVAENAKVARAFLKTIATAAPIQSISITELSERTPGGPGRRNSSSRRPTAMRQ
jgi:16S rRNA (cytidine1402-2'-O)-methyltransferase